MSTVNFFWKGDDFDLIHRISVLSYLLYGFEVVVWLSGKKPNSKYWIDDYKQVKIKNADAIIDVDDFISDGGNVKTASSLWRFTFLYRYGGLYCDTDMIALDNFPKSDWIISSCELPEKELASTGIIKVPPKQKFLLDCIKNMKKEWGNVKVFSEMYKKHFGPKMKYTHDNRKFYPFQWNERSVLFKNSPIPDAYSVHICHTFFDRKNIYIDWDYIYENKNTMLYNIVVDINTKLTKIK
jgi:hypothetical protein